MKLNLPTLAFFLFGISAAVSILSCGGQNDATTEKDSLTLFSFENGIDPAQVVTEDATFEVVDDGGQKALKVSTGNQLSKPGVVVKQPANALWDLKGYYLVKGEVANTGDEEIQVEMYVGDDPDGLTKWYCSDYIDLKPGESGIITVPLAWTPWVHEPQLEIVGMRGTPGLIKTDISKIDELSFYSRYAKQENEFLIKRVWAEGQLEVRDTAGFFPFINEYGQYIHRDWKDKIQSVEDLKKYDERDVKDIAAHPEGPNRSQYSGWTGGPKLEATGWFRTEKVDDKWWMVDPDGYPFWSAGIVCALTNYGLTGTQGREHYFKDLPKENEPMGNFYREGGWSSHGYYSDKVPFKAYNFYEANLYRKYGEDWKAKFHERMHARFDSWGMNTFGNVSDMEAAAQQKTPYTGTVWINGTPKIEGSDGFWGKFHDVFDPGFRQAVRQSMDGQRAGAGDPWCMGFFVDNEMSWGDLGSLSIGALKSPASQPAKQELIRDLKKKYGDIAKLNASWKTEHASWDALSESTTPPDYQAAKADMDAFYVKIGETYFRTMKEELDRIAPNQLYLGCRFAWANNDETVSAAAKYCDIVSFNKYEYSIENVHLPEGVDAPIMIGEFHFGALDRGSSHTGVKNADSQTDRGEKYQAYIESGLRNPQIVGAHWFQYTDQMMTGREDGENYNVGLVDMADVPYVEFIEKVRETNYGMYEYRANFK